MTPQLLELLLTAILGGALLGLLIKAIGNRITKQDRRYLPVFLGSAAAGLIATGLHLMPLLGAAWIGGGICGYVLQRKPA